MNKKSLNRAAVLALLSSLLLGCANVVTPNGGEKDVIPPVVLHVSPANHSTDFQGKTISLTFDEFVVLENPKQNILISPPLDEAPEFRLSGKTLTIKLNESLKPETTYSISFGEAVKDLHEGNVFKDFPYIFSTGKTIDSLSIEGKVIHAYDFKPAENIYVMLYADDNDTLSVEALPRHVKPYYITKADKEGKFSLSGLADNKYLIFALADVNSNYLFDLPNEEIAFIDTLIEPYYIERQKYNDTIQDTVFVALNDSIIIDTLPLADSILFALNDSILIDTVADTTAFFESRLKNKIDYELFSFVQEDSIQKVLKKELVTTGTLRFVFRYPAKDVSLELLDSLPDTVSMISVPSKRFDTITWFFTPNIDSVSVAINFDTLINDTTRYSLKPRVSDRKRQRDAEKIERLGVKTNVKNGKLKPYQPLILSFSQPIIDFRMHDTTMFISEDTLYNDLNFKKIDTFGFKYQLEKEFDFEKKYKIILPDSVFFNLKNLTNDTVNIALTVPDVTTYGNIFITVAVPENIPQVIIELLNDKDKVIEKQTISQTKKLEFLYLEPGKYKLKATLDADGNGVWSPGNLEKKLLPEKIILYPDVLEIRANWDIDLDEVWSF